jgi:3-oxoadipate enol-lactonase
MPDVRVNGLDLHYADTGQGPPLVFLNGLAGDHLYWMGQVRAFAGRFRCLALDNRDSGESSYAIRPYSVADLAEDVVGVLDALNLEAAHVVGMSLGGMIAQEMAVRYPGRVASLFLSGTLARADLWFNATLDTYALIRRQVPDTGAFFVALLPWLVSQHFFESADRVEWLRALLRQNPNPQREEGFFRQFEAMRGHDVVDRLPAVRCPVLVAVGEDDLIAPPRYSAEIYELLPHCRRELLRGVGHAPPIENPRAFNRLLEEFLEQVNAPV